MHRLSWIALIAMMSGPAYAQQQQQQEPAMLVHLPGVPAAKPIFVTEAEVRSTIHGFLAETQMTLTFYNPHGRQLEGDFIFPLPEGATVSGYALDIQGTLVDGVVVEKEKARVTFEQEVRKGVDPGLVEWVKGNNFRTRVFPLPAKGKRTVAVRYVSELDLDAESRAVFRLPLGFYKPLQRFSLRVEVQRPAGKPEVSLQAKGLPCSVGKDSAVVEQTLTNQPVAGLLEVKVPDQSRPRAVVETSSDGEVHFCYADRPQDPRSAAEREAKPPARVRILWDASGSRGRVDHARELSLLRAFFGRFKDREIQVDLWFFRNRIQPRLPFVVRRGQAEELLKAIQNATYDGGTQLGAIGPAAQDPVPDYTLLFTDGLTNFGKEEPGGFRSPLYAFSADPTADHVFLKALARKAGGDYFNLSRVKESDALAALGRPAFSFLRARVDEGRVEELVPGDGQPIQPGQGRFVLCGRLSSDSAKLTLEYGAAGKTLKTVAVPVQRQDGVPGDRLARAWAGARLGELLVSPKKNEAAITALGKTYAIVTPGTSLIVLESLEQYVEHQIPPPRSLTNLRKAYEQAMAQREQQKQKVEQEKLDAVLALWQKRVEWWNRKFELPKGGKPEVEVQGAAGGMAADRPPAAMRAQIRESAKMKMEAMDEETAAPSPSAAPALEKEVAAESKKADRAGGGEPDAPEPTITLKPWDPDTPYLRAIKQARGGAFYPAYLEQKKEHGTSPAFFLDCAEFFLGQKQQEIGLQILSNVAELELEDAALLRVLAHKLSQLNELELATGLFEEIRRLRPEEPQSHRDLALVLARQKKYERALELLAHVVMNRWDRFEEIEVIALMELNALLPRAREAGVQKAPVDPRLVKLLDVDVRLVLAWDADLTDIDLWVIEPTGQKAYYGDNLTAIGGQVSRDFTQGYGPEEYCVKKAMRGKYKVQVNYYGSRAQSLSGAVTLMLDLYTNYGRPNEKRKSVTLRLTETRETLTVGELEF